MKMLSIFIHLEAGNWFNPFFYLTQLLRVYGTYHEKSDFDFVIVVKENENEGNNEISLLFWDNCNIDSE
jgi:hypothetical protein